MVAETADKPDKLALNEELTKRVRELAESRGVNADELVESYVAELLDEDQRFEAAVREGIAQADRGELIPMEDVEAELDALAARLRAERRG